MRELAGNPDRPRYRLLFLLSLPLGLAGARLIPIVQDAFIADRLTWGLVTHGEAGLLRRRAGRPWCHVPWLPAGETLPLAAP